MYNNKLKNIFYPVHISLKIIVLSLQAFSLYFVQLEYYNVFLERSFTRWFNNLFYNIIM